jgi:hypothetical protein
MTDVNQENSTVERNEEGYIVGKDVLTFTVPKDTVKEGATAGAEIEKPFTFLQVDSDEQANEIIASKKWNLQELVNRKLKADARSSAYQAELLQHKPVTTTATPDEIKERMVRDAIRMGLAESDARAYVDSMLSAATKK